MIREALTRFNGFSMTARIVIGIAIALLVIGVGIRGVQAAKVFLFGNVEAKREHAGKVVAEEQVTAAREIGIEASNTVTRTFERHVEIEKIVREGQADVAHADHGEQMAPDIDAAGAAGLCRMHDDLCRR